MSSVTDLVFMARDYRDADEFRMKIKEYQGYEPSSSEPGDHWTLLHVFHLGVDYMDPQLREWLESGERISSCYGPTMLYLESEDDETPTVIVPGSCSIATQCRYF